MMNLLQMQQVRQIKTTFFKVIKVVFIYLILLISPEEKEIQIFNMPGDKSKLNLYYFIEGKVQYFAQILIFEYLDLLCLTV